jgi:hypothetical protein
MEWEAAPVSSNRGLQSGEAFSIPSDIQKGWFCFTNNDCSMMRMYNLCDEAGSSRYLMDNLLAQLKVQMTRNQFDPTHFSITKRDAFMTRIYHKFPSPPPEAILVQLESFLEPSTGLMPYNNSKHIFSVMIYMGIWKN